MAASKKIDFINGAYNQLRISGLTVNPDAFALETGLQRLEEFAYLAESRNIFTQYNFTEDPDYNDYTNVPKIFDLFYKSNLAVKLCPDFGKEPPPSLVSIANATYSQASGISAVNNLTPVLPPDRMPIGSGNNLRYNIFKMFNRSNPAPPVSTTTHAIYVNDVNDYFEDFTEYLRASEGITSFTMEANPALLITSQVNNSPRIDYTIQALSTQGSGNWQQIKLVINTNQGRTSTRFINFNVIPSTLGTP